MVNLKNFFGSNIFKYIITHYIISLIVATVFFYFFSKNKNQDITQLKRELVYKDSLVRVKDGLYTKLVDSYNSEKELSTKLQNSNQELADLIKKNNEKPISMTNIGFSFKPDSGNQVTQIKYIEDKKDSINFESYYPNKENFFIKHYGNISLITGKMYNNWDFGKIKFDLVVSEDSQGLWRSRISGPDYLEVNDLTVNSLEQNNEPLKIKTAFMYGGGINYNPNGTNLKIGLGVLTNKLFILGEYSTDKTIGLGVYKKF